MNETEYNERLEKLFVRFPSVQKDGFASGAYKPGLERMSAFESALGHPSEAFRTIHVAGTNGKGSVANMLASALMAAGYKVGLFTSPHIEDFRERMRIDGELISKDEVWDFLEKWEDRCDELDLSFFEITTGMAFDIFRNRGCDWAVIEVGLGGRLDSTNILEKPEATVVTSIGLDHCAMLGNTRAEIAAEKAGIFKKGVPAIVGAWDGETAGVFEDAAEKAGAELVFADRCGIEADASVLDLRGPCQDMNLRTVLATLAACGIEADATVMEGISHAAQLMDFHGRWETIHEHPEVICDIGHNPPALEVNFRKLKADGRRLHIVYGIMADKDLSGIMPLMPEDATYYLCAPDTPRAMKVQELYSAIKGFRDANGLDSSAVRAFGSVKEAVDAAMENAGEDELVYIGGSTFVVTEAVPERSRG